jgi:hypothetical protein
LKSAQLCYNRGKIRIGHTNSNYNPKPSLTFPTGLFDQTGHLCGVPRPERWLLFKAVEVHDHPAGPPPLALRLSALDSQTYLPLIIKGQFSDLDAD